MTSEDLGRPGDTVQAPSLGPSPARDQDETAPQQTKTSPALVAVVARPDDCILCGVCVEACPAQAMALGDMVVIDQQSCTACGVCVNICPNDVLEMLAR